MLPAIAVLQGISALGGIFGKKKKYMDPEMLRQLYGPQAIGKDTTELANQILNSPYGQQLMAQAAEQGQGLQTEMNARAAGAGLDASSGGESGASTFATAAGTQAQTGLERQTKAGFYQSAMPIAADLVASRMQAGLLQQGQQNAEPSTMQRIGAAAGQTAASMKPGTPSPNVDTAAPAASSLALPIPDLAPTPALASLARGPAVPSGAEQFTTGYQAPRFGGSLVGRNVQTPAMRRILMGGRR